MGEHPIKAIENELIERLWLIEAFFEKTFPGRSAAVDLPNGGKLIFACLRIGGTDLYYVDLENRATHLTHGTSRLNRARAIDKLDALYEALVANVTDFNEAEKLHELVKTSKDQAEAFLAKHDYLPPYMATKR